VVVGGAKLIRQAVLPAGPPAIPFSDHDHRIRRQRLSQRNERIAAHNDLRNRFDGPAGPFRRTTVDESPEVATEEAEVTLRRVEFPWEWNRFHQQQADSGRQPLRQLGGAAKRTERGGHIGENYVHFQVARILTACLPMVFWPDFLKN